MLKASFFQLPLEVAAGILKLLSERPIQGALKIKVFLHCKMAVCLLVEVLG